MNEEDLDFGPPVDELDLQPVADDESSVPEGHIETGVQRLVMPETTFSPGETEGGIVGDEPATLEREVVPDTVANRLRSYLSGSNPEAFADTAAEAPGIWGMEVGGINLPSLSSARRAAGAESLTGALSSLFPTANTEQPLEGRDMRHQAGLRNYADAMLLGHADELTGIRHGDDAARDRARESIDLASEQAPGSAALGQMGGSAHLAALPAGQSTALGRVMAAGGQGLGLGVIRGMGESEGESVGELASDAVESGLIEGALSAGTAGAFEAVAPAMRWAGTRGRSALDRVRDSADRNRIAAAGIRGRQFQRRLPGDTAQFAETVRESGINRRLQRPSVERSRAFRHEQGGILDRLRTEAMDARGGAPVGALVDSMETAAGNIQGFDARSGAARALLDEQAQRATAAAVDGRLPLEAVEATRRTFSQPANFAPGTHMHPLRDARRGIHDSLRSSMHGAIEEASGAPAREAYERAMRDYHVGRLTQDASEHVRSQATGNRGISLTDTIVAGAGAAGALGSGAEIPEVIATAAAAGIANRTIRGRERAITATALEGLIPVMERSGQAGAGFAAALREATQRGQPAVMAQHFLLSRANPEYRSMMTRIYDGDDAITGADNE